MSNIDIWYDFNSLNPDDSSKFVSSLSCNCKKSLALNYNMKRIQQHLYSITFNDLDEKIALSYAKQHYDKPYACSSVRCGKYFGRNFDWYYSHDVEFMVRVNPSKNRYASIGVSSIINGLDDTFVPKYEYTDNYEVIPYLMLDGINEHGVVCNINVVPQGEAGSGKKTTGTNKGKKRLPIIYIVRYVLDNCKTAKEAIEKIQTEIDWYAPNLENMNYEQHAMIADKDRTYIVEFIDNEVKVVDDDRAKIMTNFYVYGSELTEDKTKVDWHTLTPGGSGYERYNLILENYNNLNDYDEMFKMMTDTIRYSRAYTNVNSDFWWTEFVDGDNYTVQKFMERSEGEYDWLIDKVRELWMNRNRDDKKVWITNHSSVYDIEGKTLRLRTQEGDEVSDLAFGFNPEYDYMLNLTTPTTK